MGRSSKPKMSAGIMVLEPDSQKCLEKLTNDRIIVLRTVEESWTEISDIKKDM